MFFLQPILVAFGLQNAWVSTMQARTTAAHWTMVPGFTMVTTWLTPHGGMGYPLNNHSYGTWPVCRWSTHFKRRLSITMLDYHGVNGRGVLKDTQFLPWSGLPGRDCRHSSWAAPELQRDSRLEFQGDMNWKNWWELCATKKDGTWPECCCIDKQRNFIGVTSSNRSGVAQHDFSKRFFFQVVTSSSALYHQVSFFFQNWPIPAAFQCSRIASAFEIQILSILSSNFWQDSWVCLKTGYPKFSYSSCSLAQYSQSRFSG